MIRLVIFDLDGTLLNTIDDLATSTNHALRQHGFPEHELAEYPYFVGNGITKLIERALPENQRNEVTIQQLRQDFVTHYQQHNTILTRPYPGIPELLNTLHKQEIILAVASNKYHQGTVELIRHYFGTSLFHTVSGQQEGIPVKPDPTMVNRILATTKIEKSETLYVGDSGVDMQTAINSGIIPAGVTWGFRPRTELEASGARHIAEHPRDILHFLG